MTSSSGGGGGGEVRWAIVGLGDVCAVKAGPAFYECRGSTLSAVMRRTPGAAREWVRDNAPDMPPGVASSVRAFDDLGEMIREMSGDLDAVYVSSPPGAHLENVRQIVRALPEERRLRAVYVEKPCGRCAWETRAMVDELRARDIDFYPAYVSRAHERTQVLRRLIGDDRVCGDTVTHIKYTQRGSGPARGLDGVDRIPWRLDPERSGGGLIMDMGCHILDRIDYLFGPLEDIKSVVLRKGGGQPYPPPEDYVAMSAVIGDCSWSVLPSRAAVECIWDFSPDGSNADVMDELVISGPSGSLRMSGMGPGLPIEVLDADGKQVQMIEFEAPKHAAQPLIQLLVDELRRGIHDDDAGESHPLQTPVGADNAIRTSEVLDAILGSYYGGRHDDFWSRPETWPGLKPKP